MLRPNQDDVDYNTNVSKEKKMKNNNNSVFRPKMIYFLKKAVLVNQK